MPWLSHNLLNRGRRFAKRAAAAIRPLGTQIGPYGPHAQSGGRAPCNAPYPHGPVVTIHKTRSEELVISLLVLKGAYRPAAEVTPV